MTELTLEPRILRVASASPDPPFEVDTDGTKTGFDTELMRLICNDLGLTWHPVDLALVRVVKGRTRRGTYGKVIVRVLDHVLVPSRLAKANPS
jgi:ABC-type amino acid transport substrate-binding protein